MDVDQLRKAYALPWIELGSHNGTLYGVFYKVTDNATVWYDPKAFAAAGYRVPSTWTEMTTLADTMVHQELVRPVRHDRADTRVRAGRHPAHPRRE
jgi:alpha-glucoside transport system substrate-binding protein